MFWFQMHFHKSKTRLSDWIRCYMQSITKHNIRILLHQIKLEVQFWNPVSRNTPTKPTNLYHNPHCCRRLLSPLCNVLLHHYGCNIYSPNLKYILSDNVFITYVLNLCLYVPKPLMIESWHQKITSFRFKMNEIYL